jgi:hypothetical protein
MIATIVNRNLHRIAALFESALDVLEDAFQAKCVAQFQGASVDLGPDHHARLVAVKRFIELMTAGRPPAKAPDESAQDNTLTLEQLEELVEGKKPAGK